MKEVNSPRAPKPVGPYAQALKSGDLLFCAGQIALNPETGQLVQGEIREQTRQVLQNLGEVLTAAGTNFSKVVKTTVFLVDLTDFQQFNETYGEFFKPPYPVRTTIQVARLPRDARVEIDLIAEL